MAEVLDTLLRIQEAQKNKGKNAGKEMADALVTLNGLVTALQKPTVSPEEFQRGLKMLARGVQNLANKMAAVAKQHSAEMNALTKAIHGVKIPEPVVNVPEPVVNLPAPVVNIEKPDPVDLSPVIDAVNKLREDMGQIQFDIPQAVVEDRPREWSFEVKRKRAGYDITAKAK